MAKTILEDVLALLSPEEATAVRAKIAANPQLAVRDRQMTELFSIYLGEEPAPAVAPVPDPVAAPAPAVAAPYIPAVPGGPAAPVTAPVVPVAAAAASAGDSIILERLNALNTTLDTRLADIEKKFVPVDKLPAYRSEMLAASIKAADDYATVRESHRAEFNEPLDRNAFEAFVAEQSTAGVRFKDMKAAHDLYVMEKRTNKKITDGIAAGTKQAKSGAAVPGQTQAVAMSAALQVMAKARAGAPGNDKTNAMAAAEKLAAIVRSRDEAGTVVQ